MLQKDLEVRQAEMKQRQKSPQETKIISCGQNTQRHPNGMPKTDHRCERRSVDFCPFCGERLVAENAENSAEKPQPVVVSKPLDGTTEAFLRQRVIRWNKIRLRLGL